MPIQPIIAFPQHKNYASFLSHSRQVNAPIIARKTGRLGHVGATLSRRNTTPIRALWGFGNDDGGASNKTQSRRQAMMEFVNSISPSSRDDGSGGFDLPAPVTTAIRSTVTNLLGTLPPQFFNVTISTRSDNLAQLMFSVLMTGYLFANGWYRLQLSQSLQSVSPPPALLRSSVSGSVDDIEYYQQQENTGLAAGAQKLGIAGEVLKWHHEDGVVYMPALEYIEELEEQLQRLQRQLAAQQAAEARRNSTNINSHNDNASERMAATSTSQTPSLHDSYGHHNELLEYLKQLSSEQVAELTECATPDVLEAMNALVQRLLQRDGEPGDNAQWSGFSECTASELGYLLCWLMSVGHQLRTMEVKLNLMLSLDVGSGVSSSSGFGPDDGADDGNGVSDWVPRLPPGR